MTKAYSISFSDVTLQEAISKMVRLAKTKKKNYIVTPNVDHVLNYQKNARFKAAYEDAALTLLDGMPLYWALKIQGKKIREKVSGSDLFLASLEACERHRLSVYFLGASEEVNKKGTEIIQKTFPRLNIKGNHSPPFGFEKDQKVNKATILNINKTKPDVLYLFLGSPKSEIWIHENINKLDIKLALNLGASLDFVAGKYKRAPKWMQKSGIEWVWRMGSDPKRLVKRYLIDDMVPFAWLTMKELWRSKWTKK